MKATAPTGQCLRLLVAFQRTRWSAPAWALNRLGMLSERARISDLRQRWGIPIEAHIRRDGGVMKTVYEVPRGHRRDALRLIRAGQGATTA